MRHSDSMRQNRKTKSWISLLLALFPRNYTSTAVLIVLFQNAFNVTLALLQIIMANIALFIIFDTQIYLSWVCRECVKYAVNEKAVSFRGQRVKSNKKSNQDVPLTARFRWFYTDHWPNCTFFCQVSIIDSDFIMAAMASQITSITTVYSTVYSGADQRKRQSSASLAFVQGIHRWPMNSPHKWPGTRKMFTFDDVIKSVIEKPPLSSKCGIRYSCNLTMTPSMMQVTALLIPTRNRVSRSLIQLHIFISTIPVIVFKNIAVITAWLNAKGC